MTKMQNRLLMNDQLIKQLEMEREDMMFWQTGEKIKIEKHFQDVLKCLETACNSLSEKRQDDLDLKEQLITSSCLAPSPELITIQQVMIDERKMAEYNMSGCWGRVKSFA